MTPRERLVVAFALALAATIMYLPLLQDLLDTAALPSEVLVITFPFVVWGADELRRWLIRRRHIPGARQA